MKISLLIIVVLLSFSTVVAAQEERAITYADHKLGPYSANHRFEELSLQKYGYSYFHLFKPKNPQVVGYYMNGKRFTFKEGDILRLAELFRGEYDGKKGFWIQPFHYNPSAYIFMGDLIDIEKGKESSKEYKEKIATELREREEGERLERLYGILAVLGCIVFFGIYVYKGYMGIGKANTSYSDSSGGKWPITIPIVTGPSGPDRQILDYSNRKRAHEDKAREAENTVHRLKHKPYLSPSEQQDLEQAERDSRDNIFDG